MPPKMAGRTNPTGVQNPFSETDLSALRQRLTTSPPSKPWHRSSAPGLRLTMLANFHSECKLAIRRDLPSQAMDAILKIEDGIYRESNSQDQYVLRMREKIIELARTMGPQIRLAMESDPRRAPTVGQASANSAIQSQNLPRYTPNGHELAQNVNQGSISHFDLRANGNMMSQDRAGNLNQARNPTISDNHLMARQAQGQPQGGMNQPMRPNPNGAEARQMMQMINARVQNLRQQNPAQYEQLYQRAIQSTDVMRMVESRHMDPVVAMQTILEIRKRQQQVGSQPNQMQSQPGNLDHAGQLRPQNGQSWTNMNDPHQTFNTMQGQPGRFTEEDTHHRLRVMQQQALQSQHSQLVVPASQQPLGVGGQRPPSSANFSSHMGNSQMSTNNGQQTGASFNSSHNGSSPMIAQNGRRLNPSFPVSHMSPQMPQGNVIPRSSPVMQRPSNENLQAQNRLLQQQQQVAQMTRMPQNGQGVRGPPTQQPVRSSPMMQTQSQASVRQNGMMQNQSQTMAGFIRNPPPQQAGQHMQVPQPQQAQGQAMLGGVRSQPRPQMAQPSSIPLFAEGPSVDGNGSGSFTGSPAMGSRNPNGQNAYASPQPHMNHPVMRPNAMMLNQFGGESGAAHVAQQSQPDPAQYTPEQRQRILREMRSVEIHPHIRQMFAQKAGLQVLFWGEFLDTIHQRPDLVELRVNGPKLLMRQWHTRQQAGATQHPQLLNQQQTQPQSQGGPMSQQPLGPPRSIGGQASMQGQIDPRQQRPNGMVNGQGMAMSQAQQRIMIEQQMRRRENQQQHQQQQQQQNERRIPQAAPQMPMGQRQPVPNHEGLMQGMPMMPTRVDGPIDPRKAEIAKAQYRARLREMITQAELDRLRQLNPTFNQLPDDILREEIYKQQRKQQSMARPAAAPSQVAAQPGPASLQPPLIDQSVPAAPQPGNSEGFSGRGTKRPRENSVNDLTVTRQNQGQSSGPQDSLSAQGQQDLRILTQLPPLERRWIVGLDQFAQSQRAFWSQQLKDNVVDPGESHKVRAALSTLKILIFGHLGPWLLFLMPSENEHHVKMVIRSQAILQIQFDERREPIARPNITKTAFIAKVTELRRYSTYCVNFAKLFEKTRQKPTVSIEDFFSKGDNPPQGVLNPANLELLAKHEEEKRSADLAGREVKAKPAPAQVQAQIKKGSSKVSAPSAPTTERPMVDWPEPHNLPSGGDNPVYAGQSNFGELKMPPNKKQKVTQASVQDRAAPKPDVPTPEPVETGVLCTHADCADAKAGRRFENEIDLQVHEISHPLEFERTGSADALPIAESLERRMDTLFGPELLPSGDKVSQLGDLPSQPSAPLDPFALANTDMDLEAPFDLPEHMLNYDPMELIDGDLSETIKIPKDYLAEDLDSLSDPGITPDRGTNSPETTQSKPTPKDGNALPVEPTASLPTGEADVEKTKEGRPRKYWRTSFEDPDHEVVIPLFAPEDDALLDPVKATAERQARDKQREDEETARRAKIEQEIKEKKYGVSVDFMDKVKEERIRKERETAHLYPWTSDGKLPWSYRRENLEEWADHPFGEKLEKEEKAAEQDEEDDWSDGIAGM